MQVSQVRVLVRRAFPYLVIATAGFAVAYVIVLVFVLPSNIVPSRAPKVPDRPAHAGVAPLEPLPPDSFATALADTASVTPPLMPPPLPQEFTSPVEVPDLSGVMVSDARTVLEGLRLRMTTQHDTSSLQPENTVLRQIPAAGTQVAPGSTVALIVSRFPPRTDSSAAVLPESVSPAPSRPTPSQPATPQQPTTPQPAPGQAQPVPTPPVTPVTPPVTPAPTPPAQHDTAPADSTTSDSATPDSTR